MKTNYDRHAKALWVKVYQDVLERSDDDYVEAKDMANQAVAHYMAAFGSNSDVKENFTTKEPSEIYMDGWNDREAKAEKELAEVRKERDNYFDRLRELRQELADVQKLHEGKLIEVPFKVDEDDEIILQGAKHEFLTVAGYCDDNDIDQKRIKRIWLEMKSED